ncbi:hypothetical protein Tco_1103662 [Tanacetum coccineum]
MEDEFYNLVMKGNDLKTYIRRFQDLAVLCPNMVPNAEKQLEVFISGLPRSIEGNVTALKPQTLEEAINIAQRLMDQIIKHDSMQETNNHKRSSSLSPQCQKMTFVHTSSGLALQRWMTSVHIIQEVPTLVPAASTSSPSSTTVGQDAPSTSTSQTTSEQQSLVIPQGVEDDFYEIEVAHMDNDPYFGILIPEPSSEETTLQGVIPSNFHHLNQSFATLTKLTKKHPLENVIGDPS